MSVLPVSHPLTIKADANGNGRATLTAPYDMVIERVRAYTKDGAGLRVCRLNITSTGAGKASWFWSAVDESSDTWPPLHMLVSPDERPNDPCAFTGLRLKGATKYTIETRQLEGLVDYEVELVFYARPDCEAR